MCTIHALDTAPQNGWFMTNLVLGIVAFINMNYYHPQIELFILHYKCLL